MEKGTQSERVPLGGKVGMSIGCSHSVACSSKYLFIVIVMDAILET